MRTRTFLVVGLLTSLLVAGGVSYYASTHPDGLEYVAEQVGFDGAARDSATAGSPLADYQAKGIENDALSGAVAGVTGALVVLVLAAGLTYVVRRRSLAAHDDADDAANDAADLAPDEAPDRGDDRADRERG
jgi:cobalt/nickel transport protein